MSTIESATLAELDWAPELPCESIFCEHPHRAEYSVRYTCSCLRLVCGPMALRALGFLDRDGYCPVCWATGRVARVEKIK